MGMVESIFLLMKYLFVISAVVVGAVYIYRQIQRFRELSEMTLQMKAKIGIADENTLDDNKDYISMDLNAIFAEANLCYIETTEKIVKEKSLASGFRDVASKVREENKVPPKFRLLPEGAGFKREMYIETHEKHRLSIPQINAVLPFILRVLKQKDVIEYERGEVIAGELPTEFVFKFFSKEDEEAERMRSLKESAGLFKVIERNGRKEYIYPELTKAKNGDVIVHVPEGVIFTDGEILRSVSRLKAFYNEDFDDKKTKRVGDTFIIRKKVPVSNFLTGFKKIKIVNEKGEESYTDDPKSILDRWEDWLKEFGQMLRDKFKNGLAPEWYIGQNQEDDGSGITHLFLQCFKYAHFFIAGTTGSGKTETAKSMLIHRLFQNIDTLVIYFDGKKADTFRLFAEYTSPYRLLIPREDLSQPLYELYWAIDKFYQEYLRRQKLFQGRAEDIDSFNRKFPKERLNEWILVMEEWGAIASTFLNENDLKKPAPGSPADQLMVMLRGARSYGLQLMFISQSGKDNEVPNVLKELTNKLIHRGDKTFCGYFDVPEAEQLEKGQFIYPSEWGNIKMRNLYIGKVDLEDILIKAGFQRTPMELKKEIDYDQIFLTSSGENRNIKDKAKFLKKFLRDEGFTVSTDSKGKPLWKDNPETADIFLQVERTGAGGVIKIAWMYIQPAFFNNKEINERMENSKADIHVILYKGELPQGKENQLITDKQTGQIRPHTFVINESRFNRMIDQAIEFSTSGEKEKVFTNRLMKLIEEEQGDGNQDADFDKTDDVSHEEVSLPSTPAKKPRAKKASGE